MTKIRDTGSNPYIEDRRGATRPASGSGFPGLGGALPDLQGCGGKKVGVGGGGLALLVVLAAVVLPKLLGGGGSLPDLGGLDPSIFTPTPPPGAASPGSASGADACDTETAQIICGAVSDVNEFWAGRFAANGGEYPPARTVFYSGATQTACGLGQAQAGPFYCPLDSLVYFDLDFLEQLQAEFGAEGDLAAQYIVAHEYGHHVQNVLGISERVRQLQQRDPANANDYSIRQELQADCLAGVWAHDANARGLFDPGEVSEALEAAAAVGDDRIQQQSGGVVNPESWTHGSSAQREEWFRRGFDLGDPAGCNTFS